MGKHMGKWIAFAAIAGAAAAGISYLTKYKSFHKELEEDFHDFEDESEGDDGAVEASESMASKRKYVSLSSDKDEFVVAAKDMVSAAKDMVKDTSSIVGDTYRDVASIAKDSAMTAKDKVSAAKDRVHEKVSEKKDEWKEKFYGKRNIDGDEDLSIDDLDDDFDFSDDFAQVPEEPPAPQIHEEGEEPAEDETGTDNGPQEAAAVHEALSQEAQDIAGAVAQSTKMEETSGGSDEEMKSTATITEES